MNAREACTEDVVCTTADATLAEAANQMRNSHVGTLVVVEPSPHGPTPIGILTDRDIVVGVLARDVEHLGQLLVGEVVGQRPLVVVEHEESVADAAHRMALNGVRRMPVVDENGVLVGILTMDDLVATLAEQLNALASLVPRQIARERLARN